MRAGRILIALLFGIGIAGVALNGSALYSRFLYLSVLLVLLAWIWSWWVKRSLTLERTSRELRANVGDVFEESYKLFNKSIIPIPWIEIFNQSGIPQAGGSRLLTLVMGRQRRSYTARSWLTQRGSFQLGPTKLTVGDPFGLFATSKVLDSHESLIVFPMIQDIQSFPSPPGILPGGQVIQKRSQEVTPHAAGVREYVHGDEMKRIHWPTSARRNRLMVKEFEQDPQSEIWLFLDCQKNVHAQRRHQQDEMPLQSVLLMKRPKIKLPPSTLEYSVSIAASLAHYFIGQRRAVGYASAGQRFIVLPAERSQRLEEKILETLAFVEANGTLSIAALVAAQASQLPQRSSVVLITSTVRPDLLQAVDDLLLRHLYPVVILLDAHTFGGPTGTESLIRSLHERRIPVNVVACDDDLSQVLSSIPSQFKKQGYQAWQAPVSLHST